jgi:hypothetical protein
VSARIEHAPPLGSAPGSSEGRWILGVYILISIASLIPYGVFQYPEIVDFPEHWARFYVECHISERPVAEMYELALAVIPNLATDLLNLGLCGVVDPRFVLLGSMVAAQAILYLAIVVVQRALWGRIHAFAALIPALGFNLVTFMGYANYLLGMALSFLLFALALRVGHRSKPRFILLCNLLGSLIFLSHIFALLLSIAFVFFFTAQNWFGHRGWLRRLAASAGATAAGFMLPSLGLLVMNSPGSSPRLDYLHKGRSIAAPFLGGFAPADALISVAVVVLLVVALRRRQIKIATVMRWPLAGLAALTLVLPNQISDAVDVDARIALAVFILLLASMAVPPGGRRMERGILAMAGAILLLRLASIGFEWTRFDRDVTELRSALSDLQPGSKLLTVFADGNSGNTSRGAKTTRWSCGSVPHLTIPYWHLASLATIDRQAFSALGFAGRGMQPIALRPGYAYVELGGSPLPSSVALLTMGTGLSSAEADAIRGTIDPDALAPYFIGWPAKFDTVIFFHFRCPTDFSPAILEEIRSGSFFTIYAVRHTQ